MKKILIFTSCILLILLSVQFVQARDIFYYYNIELDYDKGNININSIEIEFSEKEIENNFGFYIVNLIDINGDNLNVSFFDIPNKILIDEINPETGEINSGGLRELDKVSFNIFIPYYENAKEIVIYNESLEEVARKDVGEYSKERVSVTTKVIEDTEKDSDEKEISTIDKEKSFMEKLSNYWWVLLVILLILIIVFVYLMLKKTPIQSKKYQHKRV
jgi:hypothetical protein